MPIQVYSAELASEGHLVISRKPNEKKNRWRGNVDQMLPSARQVSCPRSTDNRWRHGKSANGWMYRMTKYGRNMTHITNSKKRCLCPVLPGAGAVTGGDDGPGCEAYCIWRMVLKSACYYAWYVPQHRWYSSWPANYVNTHFLTLLDNGRKLNRRYSWLREM